uniref:Uncharacterized protein n=1 Tax=Arundo donax TaxID=35708 RepID=A0A0A9U3K5_ARUDO
MRINQTPIDQKRYFQRIISQINHHIQYMIRNGKVFHNS